jgi:hypothetical protein
VGKHLLAGITVVDVAEEPIEQRRVHGLIVRINPVEGVVIALHSSGEEFKLPPDMGNFRVAPRGEYRLRGTGEVVVDPDLTCLWVLKRPVQ